jgi:cation:H+ antiporter
VIHFALLLVCAVVIYVACEWFVNAVEWLGQRLRVGPLAVGSVLAAFGTALPESVVTFVAVVFGTDARQKDIGVGAAMGGPLVLATIAYGVTGWMMLARRLGAERGGDGGAGGVSALTAPTAGEPAPAGGLDVLLGLEVGDLPKLARDQRWFLGIFLVKVALGLVAFSFKPWLGLLFFTAYAVYFWREISGDDDSQHDENLVPLRLQRHKSSPDTLAVAVQVVATLVIIFAASQLFVRQLDAVGPMLGLSAAVSALLLSPIATELPEVMNAIIWVRQGKTRLALANISGAMMIQATVPSGLGLLFTPWRFDTPLLISGLTTIAAIGYLLTLLRTRRFTPTTLSLAAVFYLAFAASLIIILS